MSGRPTTITRHLLATARASECFTYGPVRSSRAAQAWQGKMELADGELKKIIMIVVTSIFLN